MPSLFDLSLDLAPDFAPEVTRMLRPSMSSCLSHELMYTLSYASKVIGLIDLPIIWRAYVKSRLFTRTHDCGHRL